jgi:hypothetical protein
MQRIGCLTVISLTLLAGACFMANSKAEEDPWQAPKSTASIPHFQGANGHRILYVANQPFSMLAVEIPWWDLRAGHYREDETVYDKLYAKARELGANTLKVPVKWSMIEPVKDQYDYSYIDHAIKMASQNHLHLVLDWFGHYASGDGNIYRNLSGELFAPMYIVKDEITYPRAVDGDGKIHHNAISYDSPAIVDREVKAFRGFMLHLKNFDTTHVVVGVQLENEISVFGGDRHNAKLWRDHSPESNRKFAAHGFVDDLKYSAWDMSTTWIKPLTEAAKAAYPIPVFHNYVGGSLAEGMVGGSPGEDVQTYLDDCPDLSFIAVNAYLCAKWNEGGCESPSQAQTQELRETLKPYAISRNVPAVTETNSGSSLVAPRFAFVALGEFGVPIFAPWSLTMSYPESSEPYVLPDGRLANGAFQLRDAYQALKLALPQVLLYAGTDKQKVFQSPAIGKKMSADETVNGIEFQVSGPDDGQAIVTHPSANQILIVGYRATVSFKSPKFEFPEMQQLQVQRVRWTGNQWANEGETFYGVDQSSHSLWIDLEYPQAVLVALP